VQHVYQKYLENAKARSFDLSIKGIIMAHQERQCAYHVTWRHICATVVAA
jgi:hypothetical protein